MEDNNNNQTPTTTTTGEQNLAVNAYMDFGDEIRKLLPTAGTLQVNQQQSDIIFAPVADNEILVKPDGLVYLSWTKYASRLSRAFGTSWGLVPQGMPKMSNNNLVVWPFHLIIKGVYCGFAIGEQEYIPSNKRMTYGEACEGAKSNALTRLCKALGIGLELWDKAFINRWLNNYTDKKWEDAKSQDQKGKFVYSLKQGAFSNMTQPNNQKRYVAPVDNTSNSTTSAPVVQPVSTTNTTTTEPVTPVTTNTTTTPTPVTEPTKTETVSTVTEPTKTETVSTTNPTTTEPVDTTNNNGTINDNGTTKPETDTSGTTTPPAKTVTTKPESPKKTRLYTGKASSKNIAENQNFLNEKGTGMGITMEAIEGSEKIPATTKANTVPVATTKTTSKTVATTTNPTTPVVVVNTVEINGIVFNDENEPEDPYMNLLFQHWKKIVQAKTTGLLKSAYDQVKADYNNGKIVEDHKETLRKLSNKLFIGLSTSGKG